MYFFGLNSDLLNDTDFLMPEFSVQDFLTSNFENEEIFDNVDVLLLVVIAFLDKNDSISSLI